MKVHTPDKGSWAYRYDAFNRRVEKVNTGTGASVRFVWDGYTVAERWGQKRDGSTGTATTWHFEPDSHTPLAQETDAQHYAVFCNPTGLPLEIYRTTGEKVWASRYNLWGQALPEDALPDDEALDTSLRFAGQWADEESGLHYNLNRYYDPDSGCYLSIDPIAIRGGHRTQGYVQNPLWEVDPLGLAVCEKRYARYKELRNEGMSPAEAARLSREGALPGVPGSQGGTAAGGRKFGPKSGESEPNWGDLVRKYEGDPPADMTNPHGHHAVFKKGRGTKMREYLDESKDILENYDIDWYKGRENLGWAPNKNHSTAAAKAVRDALKDAHENIGTKEAVVEALSKIKKHFRDDTIGTIFE